jgi:hypothetical protein
MAGSSPAMTKGEPETDAPPDFWRFEWELSELRQGVPSPSISGGSNGNFAAPPRGVRDSVKTTPRYVVGQREGGPRC